MSDDCERCLTWAKLAKMVEDDGEFFLSSYNEETQKHDGGTYLCVNMNDVWGWACADAEHVPWKDIPHVYDLWKKDKATKAAERKAGEEKPKDGDEVFIWACLKRGDKPQKPMMANLRLETQERLEHLPRAGDVVVPVGDGKVVTFDDGWGDKEKA